MGILGDHKPISKNFWESCVNFVSRPGNFQKGRHESGHSSFFDTIGSLDIVVNNNKSQDFFADTNKVERSQMVFNILITSGAGG